MSKRKKEALGPFAGVDRLPSHGLPNDAFGLLGTKLTVHEDALGTISSAVENNLLHLGNDESNAVDRFDVRLLLDDIAGVTSIRPTSASAVADHELEEELDEERYADLAHAHEVDAAASPTVSSDETLEHGTSYQAVGLSYGEDSAAPQESEGATLFNPGFDVPPEHQHAMRGMTEQQHKVMMQTARFVRHEGDQLELVLRIRQGHNVSFTFLKPDSPLYDYYRWLVQAQPQAREATASKASPAAAAAVEEQHDEPSGALSHLISMYGASQDEANTASPKGTTNAADALGTVSQPVLTMPAGQGAGDHPVQEGSLQSTKAPSAPSSSEQENDRRGMAGAGGSEVAEQAAQQAQQAQRAEQPPPEVQGIVVKLLAFVKKSGVKFEASIREREASNPRFGFLLPGHPFHSYYREQIVANLGEEKAAELLATLPTNTASAPLEEDLSSPLAARAKQAPKPQPAGQTVQVTIRSNPSLAKIAFARRQNPLAEAGSVGDTEAGDAQALDPASEASPEETVADAPANGQANTHDRQDNGERRVDGGSSDSQESTEDTRDRDESPGLSDVLMEGAAEQHAQRASAELAKAFDKGQGLEAALQAAAEADARKADEALKAERRRLAMQLLAARRSEAEAARREERSAPTAQAIARHRLALLAEESDSQDREPEAEEAEAGEIAVAKVDSVPPGAQIRTASLPKLEEVIRPPPPKQETSSESSSSSKDNDDQSRRKRGSRSRRRSPDSRHRAGSPGQQRRQREQNRSAELYSERGTERKRRRSSTHSTDEIGGSTRDGRHRRKSLPEKERRHAKGSREGADNHERHKHKRPKHRKEASSKGEERHRSHSKGLDEPNASKSEAKHRHKSEKRHDWGNTRTESKQKVASPSAMNGGPTVLVSEVPDDLRARIKAMLAKS